MARPTPALLLAVGLLLLVPLLGTHKGGLTSFAAAAAGDGGRQMGQGPKGPSGSSGSGRGSGGESGDSGDSSDDAESSSSKDQKPPNRRSSRPGSSGKGKPSTPSKGSQSGTNNNFASSAIPLLWNAAANASTASDEAADLEEYSAALSRIFEKRLAYQPRIRGALEDINEALSRDLLESNTKMPPSERQRILYGLGGRGSYMEVPALLHELRQEADHPVEEQRRIKALHSQRRRGIPISMDDLKMRPFVKRDFEGPVTTTDVESNLNDAELQMRQAGVNGWLQMQNRVRILQKQQMRHRRAGPSNEPINDDDFPVDDEDVIGLSFSGKLSDEEGGEFAKEYNEYLAKVDSGEDLKSQEGTEEQDSEDEGEEE